mmetsp:Transcript_23110/g.37028  ORF Transcript_23110/g.37028 Transcript_23110/m.37028 type:complete len:208 (+) Transcript_23110:320-943(+)
MTCSVAASLCRTVPGDVSGFGVVILFARGLILGCVPARGQTCGSFFGKLYEEFHRTFRHVCIPSPGCLFSWLLPIDWQLIRRNLVWIEAAKGDGGASARSVGETSGGPIRELDNIHLPIECVLLGKPTGICRLPASSSSKEASKEARAWRSGGAIINPAVFHILASSHGIRVAIHISQKLLLGVVVPFGTIHFGLVVGGRSTETDKR